jgi:hypothetical protein
MDGQSPNFEPHEVPLARVEGAYLELMEHNDRHTGMGVAMGGLLGALIRTEKDDGAIGENEEPHIIDMHTEEFPETTDYDNGTSLTIKQQGEMSKDITAFTVDPVFEEIGLSRMDGSSVAIGTGEAFTSATQTLMISNPSLFVTFLDRAKTDFENHPALKELAADVYGRLIGLINSTVGENITEEEATIARETLVDMLERVQPTYRDIDFVGQGVNLSLGEAYVNWGRKEEFPDFVKARELGLRETNTYSAAEWHLDSPEEGYSDRWGKLLEHYRGVMEKYGEDNDLSMLMKLELNDALFTASDWLKNPTYVNESYVNAIRRSFEKVQKNATQLGLMDKD